MVKKGGEKKSSHENLSHQRETERLLVENFVALQKVMANLSQKFDTLTRQISELLKLFEDSAKVIVKNEIEKKKEDRGDKQLLDTMVSILDQNKVIAKGLTLMYETIIDSGSFSKQSFGLGSTTSKIISQPEKRQMIKEDRSYSSSINSDSSSIDDSFSMES